MVAKRRTKRRGKEKSKEGTVVVGEAPYRRPHPEPLARLLDRQVEVRLQRLERHVADALRLRHRLIIRSRSAFPRRAPFKPAGRGQFHRAQHVRATERATALLGGQPVRPRQKKILRDALLRCSGGPLNKAPTESRERKGAGLWKRVRVGASQERRLGKAAEGGRDTWQIRRLCPLGTRKESGDQAA
jgi:hypothetical protein